MDLPSFVRRNVCLAVLLYFPTYFASQAEKVAPYVEVYANQPDVDELTLHSPSAEDEEADFPIALPSVAHTASSSLPRAWNSDGPFVSSTSESYTTFESIRRFRSNSLQSAWKDYVEDRCKEWIVIASVSGTVLGASLSLIQTPATNVDPVTRCFLYLFILRMVAAVPSALVLSYYFRKDVFRTADFAVTWYKGIKKYNDSWLYTGMPWTILALPLIVFCWGIIFLLVALFTSIWHNGLYLNPPPGLDKTLELEFPIMILIRVIATMMSMVDLGWIAWLVMKLKALMRQ